MKFIKIIGFLSLFIVASCEQKNINKNEDAKNPIAIEDARIRITPNGTDTTAAYLNVINNTNKNIKIINASSNIATKIEMHTSSINSEKMIHMEKVTSFDVPANGYLELAPNGSHLMLFGTSKDIKLGGKANINLTFEDGNHINTDAIIVANPVINNNLKSEKRQHQH